MQKLQEIWKSDNKTPFLYGIFAASLAAAYYFYGRNMLAKHYDIQLKKKKNLLDTNFAQLLRLNSNRNIFKIVITQASNSTGDYRKLVIDKIKQLAPSKNWKILINCSPKKLYDAGCQSFVASFQPNDEEYIDYIINFLKTQLLVQDTIQKIEKVSHMQDQNPDFFSIMLCDNNCMDMKRITTQDGNLINKRVQHLALERLKIKQVDIYDLYTCVIHLQQDKRKQSQAQAQENKFIQQLWGSKDYRGFYQNFKYDQNKCKQDNVSSIINFITQKVKEQRKNRGFN